MPFGRLRRRPPSGGRSRRPFCYEMQGSACRQCMISRVLVGPAKSDRAKPTAIPPRCPLPPRIVARPGFLCIPPASPPTPDRGEGGWPPSNVGGGAVAPLSFFSHLRGFARCHQSGGAELFRITFQGADAARNASRVRRSERSERRRHPFDTHTGPLLDLPGSG